MELSSRIALENRLIFVIVYQNAEVVEPGRHARLRGVWGNPCGFKSRLRHHKFCLYKTKISAKI